MNTLINILEFLKSVSLLTLSQLLSIFGVLFFFGLVLYLLARFTRRVYVKSAGSTLDIILTGWIGVPVHELGHALFCLVFLHRIDKIKLFDPNPRDGSIGYVIHSYNRKNLWHRIGNFFIGVGPVIVGAFALYAAMYFLVPSMKSVFAEMKALASSINWFEPENWRLAVNSFLASTKLVLVALTEKENFSSWEFWVFIYLSMSIASHMELSPSDLKSALSGFIIILLIVFVLNLIFMLLESAGAADVIGDSLRYFSLQHYSAYLTRFAALGTGIFIYATTISAINFLLSWILLSLYTLIVRGKGINPFWG